jgi:hypothetical protein
MCKYAIDFQENGVNGYNLGYAPQFFYYTDLTLREYSKCFNSGCVVVITCADLVFVEPGKGIYFSPQMMKMFSRKRLGDEFSWLTYLKDVKYPLLFHPGLFKRVLKRILKKCSMENDDYIVDYNPLNDAEMEKSAQQICDIWCKSFNMKDTLSDDMPEGIDDKFEQSRNLLTSMIQYCLDNGFRPVLAIIPVSRELNSHLSNLYIERVLYNNLIEANKQGVPVLDYLRDERFQNHELYLNSFKLNLKGRRLFTKTLVEDLKQLKLQ